jgi:outer membrane protein
MRTILILLISLFIFSCSEKKDGFVQVSTLYNEFEMTKELNKNLEANVFVKTQILDSLKFNITQLELQLKMNQTEDLFKQYEIKKQEFLYKERVFQDENQRLRQQYNEQSLAQINTYVEAYGNELGYAYIYGASGNGSLMFADDSKDLTAQILIYINEKYQGN